MSPRGNTRLPRIFSEVFADAKVKLHREPRAVKFVLRTSEVKFARFAIGELNYPQDNFTWPEGKLSFSVNTQLRVSH